MGHVCQVTQAPDDPTPFKQGDQLHFKAHYVGWLVCGFMTAIASATSLWLIWKHLTYYTCPQQQRHIVRMLFMVPIYALVSTLSYVFFKEAIYYETVRDCYEAVVITSFFYLLAQYVGDTPAEQHEVFRMVKLKKWFWPLGFVKYRPTGLHFYWLMKICILQYALVRPTCTIAAVVMQYLGVYCYDSWAPYFGHIYITLSISISVTVAMYSLVQFYLPIQDDLKPFKPILKFICIKSIVFLTFWQDSFLSILVYFKVIKPTQFMTAEDIQVGYDALLETSEMVLFAFLHIKAFTYVIYRPADEKRVTRRWRAFLDVLDYRDWYYQMMQTTRYIAAKSRGRDFTIAEGINRARHEHLEKALGRDRMSTLKAKENGGTEPMPSFWAAGCEPRGDEEEQERFGEIPCAHREEEVDSVSTPTRTYDSPQYLAAMSPAYDPEADDDRALDEYMPGEVEMRRHEMRQMLPTAPSVRTRAPDHAQSTSALQTARPSRLGGSRPLRDYRDDPEMDKPSRAGWVTAGPKSFLQSKMRRVADKIKGGESPKERVVDEPTHATWQQEHPNNFDFQEQSRDPVPQSYPGEANYEDPESYATRQEEIGDARYSPPSGPQSQYHVERRSMPPPNTAVHSPVVDFDEWTPDRIPAPSQLLQHDDAGPFAIARAQAFHATDAETRVPATTSPSSAAASRDRPRSLQVGSIISPQDLASVTSPPGADLRRASHASRQVRQDGLAPRQRASQFQQSPYPRPSHRWSLAATSVAPQQGQAGRATRHSAGQMPYDASDRQREDQHVHQRQIVPTEQRDGFHFEYLD